MQLFKTDFKSIEVYKIIEGLDSEYYIYKILTGETTITWLIFDQYHYLTNKPIYDISTTFLHQYKPLTTVEKDKILLIIKGVLLLDTMLLNSINTQDILALEYCDSDSDSDSGSDYGFGNGYSYRTGAGSDNGRGYGTGPADTFSYNSDHGHGDGYSTGPDYGDDYSEGTNTSCNYGSGSDAGSGYNYDNGYCDGYGYDK